MNIAELQAIYDKAIYDSKTLNELVLMIIATKKTGVIDCPERSDNCNNNCGLLCRSAVVAHEIFRMAGRRGCTEGDIHTLLTTDSGNSSFETIDEQVVCWVK